MTSPHAESTRYLSHGDTLSGSVGLNLERFHQNPGDYLYFSCLDIYSGGKTTNEFSSSLINTSILTFVFKLHGFSLIYSFIGILLICQACSHVLVKQWLHWIWKVITQISKWWDAHFKMSMRVNNKLFKCQLEETIQNTILINRRAPLKNNTPTRRSIHHLVSVLTEVAGRGFGSRSVKPKIKKFSTVDTLLNSRSWVG